VRGEVFDCGAVDELVGRGDAFFSAPPVEAQAAGLPQGDLLLTMQEAAALLGVSRFQMSALVKRMKLRVYETPTDMRRKLLRRSDVEALAQPRLKVQADDGDEGKAKAA
jgi:excisionase family DNA binding protein